MTQGQSLPKVPKPCRSSARDSLTRSRAKMGAGRDDDTDPFNSDALTDHEPGPAESPPSTPLEEPGTETSGAPLGLGCQVSRLCPMERCVFSRGGSLADLLTVFRGQGLAVPRVSKVGREVRTQSCVRVRFISGRGRR